jgi:integrase/recombinase XerC
MRVPEPSDTEPAWVDAVLERLASEDSISSQTAESLAGLIRRFGRYLDRGHRITTLDAVTPDEARGFLAAPVGERSPGPPSVATMHLRRTAVRLAFRIARDLGLAQGDPALDLRLPPRSSLRMRALTDDEVILCRSCSLATLTATRQPAAWALAEATARTSEIPHVRACDLDLAAARVWIHGGTKTVARWGHLTPWGATQLSRRLSDLGVDRRSDALLAYEGRGSAQSQQASSCAAVAQTIVRAGLTRERDVAPSSVAAWAGARLFAEGHPIDEVAQRLGVRSLDRAASLIAWNWNGEP